MHDVHLSLLSLRRAVEAVAEAGDYERLLGRVLAVARLVRGDRLLAAAAKDLERDPLARDAATVAAAADRILVAADQIEYELADLYHPATCPAWVTIVDAPPDLLVRWHPEALLRDVLRNRRQRPLLSEGDVLRFCAGPMPKLIEAIEQAAHPSLAVVTQYLQQLKRHAAQLEHLDRFRKLCATGSVAGIVARLDRLLDEWDRRLRQGPDGPDWALPPLDVLGSDVALLASRVETFLAGRRTRRFVLHRAKAYFEHFFRDEAREVLGQEEARVAAERAHGKHPKAQRELSLRRHLDRFIFQEGFFPITEASAAAGNLDMLLADADAAGIRPMVIEVKQAARIEPDSVRASDVRDAIAAARREIAKYQGHLRARSGWEDVEPMVVVFHTSVEDVSELEQDEVMLIYIGSLSPSQLKAAAVLKTRQGQDSSTDRSGSHLRPDVGRDQP
ncbi:MAG TPA: hypothetical protein VHE35_23980 [Kofleriaceae bacterium]|nr:hypothetical protein [Kofleriaceae bacterium]